MFGKKKAATAVGNNDLQVLLDVFDKIISGEISQTGDAPADATLFSDPAVADKFNTVVETYKRFNNNFVMRLNEAMGSIGDNSYVKNMIDEVQSQAQAIGTMGEAGHNLEESINHITSTMADIKDNTHEMLAATQNSTANMNESIKVVNESSAKITDINRQVQEFQDKIHKIGEIVDIVKKVASQSNLLALNASIEAARAGEAGKGFAVVADQVRQLSSSTAESADDIVNYVRELNEDIGRLAASMDETTLKLSEGNEKVEASLADIERMNRQMVSINDSVTGIFADIDTQSSITTEFAKQVDSIAASYDKLSDNCMATGIHIYKIGRYIDTARSDMFRSFSNVTVQDMLRVFEIDHFILMWRVYNNAAGFEQLKITQLNNPESCKLGKWMCSQTDPQITGSRQFKELDAAHKQVHKHACDSWYAKDSGNVELAMEHFQKCYDAYGVYKDKIAALKEYMRTIGYTDETETVVFRK
ncbi:MAG: methyl-accepting chemotaxis protein [Clostridia bacterium]|nr:methyl-accepting chemotaxis protein [Clostridia bacterium]